MPKVTEIIRVVQGSEYVSDSRASELVLYAILAYLYVILPIYGKWNYLKESFQNALGVNRELSQGCKPLMLAMQTSEQGVGS